MIRITFIAQNKSTKLLVKSSPFFHEDSDEQTMAIINARKVVLASTLPDHRVFVLIENV